MVEIRYRSVLRRKPIKIYEVEVSFLKNNKTRSEKKEKRRKRRIEIVNSILGNLLDFPCPDQLWGTAIRLHPVCPSTHQMLISLSLQFFIHMSATGLQ